MPFCYKRVSHGVGWEARLWASNDNVVYGVGVRFSASQCIITRGGGAAKGGPPPLKFLLLTIFVGCIAKWYEVSSVATM